MIKAIEELLGLVNIMRKFAFDVDHETKAVEWLTYDALRLTEIAPEVDRFCKMDEPGGIAWSFTVKSRD